jgi:fumarate reductase subunit C
MEENVFMKNLVLSIFLNVATLQALRISAGRLFHSVGAVTWNDLSPKVVNVFVPGFSSNSSVDDRRLYLDAALSLMSSEIFSGARPLIAL